MAVVLMGLETRLDSDLMGDCSMTVALLAAVELPLCGCTVIELVIVEEAGAALAEDTAASLAGCAMAMLFTMF